MCWIWASFVEPFKTERRGSVLLPVCDQLEGDTISCELPCDRGDRFSIVTDGCTGGTWTLSASSNSSISFEIFSTFMDFRTPVMALRHAIRIQSCNVFLNWFKLVSFMSDVPAFGLLMVRQ